MLVNIILDLMQAYMHSSLRGTSEHSFTYVIGVETDQSYLQIRDLGSLQLTLIATPTSECALSLWSRPMKSPSDRKLQA